MNTPASGPSRTGRRLVTLVLLAGVAFGVWWITSRDSSTQEEPPPVPFENTSLDVAYVGSAACKTCHEDLCDSYGHTSHGRSFSKPVVPEKGLPTLLHHKPSGLHYEIYARDGKIRVREHLQLGAGDEITIADRALAYAIGSGRRMQAYAVENEGFLGHAPVSSYPRTGKWKMSFGFEDSALGGFNRPLDARCLSCHVGRLDEAATTSHRFRILEETIGCENCHGPGAKHVERHRSGTPHEKGAFDPTIMNPARATRSQAMDVCSRCHDPANLVVLASGTRLADWRPGLLLRDFRVRYRQEPDDGMLILEGHADQLRNSKCFQGSAALSCRTCHDPHASIESKKRPLYYRAACVKCHQPNDCGMEESKRLETTPEDSCVVCHMARVPPTEAKPHGVLTNHRIAVHRAPTTSPGAGPKPGGAQQGGAPEYPELHPIDDVSHLSEDERNRNLGLAWLHRAAAGLPMNLHKYARDTAEKLLEDVHKRAYQDDPVVLGALGLLGGVDRLRKSLEFSEASLASKKPGPLFVRITALYRAADIKFKGHQLEDAAALLQELVQLRRSERDWSLLALVSREAEDQETARTAIEKAIEIAPHDPDIRFQAGEIFGWLGDEPTAEKHRKTGEALVRRRGVRPPGPPPNPPKKDGEKKDADPPKKKDADPPKKKGGSGK